MKIGDSVYRAGGMFILMHEYIMSVPHSQLIVRLLADEVDALYLCLDGAMDECVEGAGKVHSSTLPFMKREGSSI